MTSIFILISAFVYLWSVVTMRNYIRIAYSDKGVWAHDPDGVSMADAIVALTPILNTMFAVEVALGSRSPYSYQFRNEKPRKQRLNKIFGVKR